MKFKVHLDGREHYVQAKPDGSIMVDGETFACKIDAPETSRRMVQMGEKNFDIRVVEKKGEENGERVTYLFDIAGERVPVTVTEVTREAAAASPASGATVPVSAAAGPDDGEAGGARAGGEGAPSSKTPEQVKEGVWAPVPGKIVNLLVQPGGRVKQGQAVVVLEAMKMENELHAPKDATVTAVLVAKGDQVERGQLLVALE